MPLLFIVYVTVTPSRDDQLATSVLLVLGDNTTLSLPHTHSSNATNFTCIGVGSIVYMSQHKSTVKTHVILNLTLSQTNYHRLTGGSI